MVKASEVQKESAIEPPTTTPPATDKLVLMKEQLKLQLDKSKVRVGTVIIGRESNRQVVYTEDGKFRPVTLKSEVHVDLSEDGIDKVESLVAASMAVSFSIALQWDQEQKDRKRVV